MMEDVRRHIWLWMQVIGLGLMTVGCSSSDGEAEEPQATYLTIYVYSPERPMLMRSEVGPVSAAAAESKVNKLQIWVFESGSGKKVGYLEKTDTEVLNGAAGATYQIKVDDDFARNKPQVDVYVLANVYDENCGTSFTETSSRTYLRNNAKIKESYFGLDNPVTAVPDKGLPMSGILRNQEVIGDAPILRISSEGNIATVSLTRAVSKIRFVFTNINTSGAPELNIKEIKLNGEMIPTEEYLIPQTKTLNYNQQPVTIWTAGTTEPSVYKVDDPAYYIYRGQTAQEYENLIDDLVVEGNAAGKTTEIGPFYLRESDKKLVGSITYQIVGNIEKTSPFNMDAAGDFTRNHTWIVYAYHSGGGYLQMSTLYVKNWNERNVNHDVYNW